MPLLNFKKQDSAAQGSSDATEGKVLLSFLRWISQANPAAKEELCAFSHFF